MSKTIILIPTRLAATRLPNKPLLKINGISIINHVYEKAKSSEIGDVFVATGDKEIFEEVTKKGGKCVLTEKEHLTGTDNNGTNVTGYMHVTGTYVAIAELYTPQEEAALGYDFHPRNDPPQDPGD